MKLEINHRKRNEKKTDDVENKQHATKKPMGQRGNQKANLKNTSKHIMKTQLFKIYGMLQKQCIEGSS